MPTLEEIFKFDQANTEEVVSALKQRLKEERLEWLFFERNNLVPPPTLINLLKALEDNDTLTALCVSNANDLTNPVIDALIITLKKNTNITEIMIEEDSEQNSNLVNKIAHLLENNQSSLREITLYTKNAQHTKRLVTALKKNKTLKCLDLSEAKMNEETILALINALNKNSELAQLNLSRLFSTLSGRFTNKMAPKLFTVLFKNNTGITDLNLANAHITYQSTRALANAIKKNDTLTSLNLRKNFFDIKLLITALQKNNTLKKIGLSIRKYTELQDYDSLTAFDAFARFLETNQSLTSLDLGFSDITHIEKLAHSLKKNSTIIELTPIIEDEHTNNYSVPYAQHLQETFYRTFDELLAVNQTITILNINSPREETKYPSQKSEEAYQRIQMALERNQALVHQKISGKIQEANKMIPSVLADLISQYVGYSLLVETPKSKSIPEKPWMHRIWDKLWALIHNTWKTIKNKFRSSSNINQTSDNNQNNLELTSMPAPTAPITIHPPISPTHSLSIVPSDTPLDTPRAKPY